MAALSADRNTPSRPTTTREPPVKAGAVLFAGSMGAIDANGLAVPASAVSTLKVIGRVEARADNLAGANGDIRAKIGTGTFRFDNSSSADLISLKDVGSPCYVVDDHTVALTSNAAARPVAGTIFDVDPVGVWVRFT